MFAKTAMKSQKTSRQTVVNLQVWASAPFLMQGEGALANKDTKKILVKK